MTPKGTLSNDTEDKLQACLHQTWTDGEYIANKRYYDACMAWWDSMDPDQQAIGEAALNVYSFENPAAAIKFASKLPPAPKSPWPSP